MDPITSNVELLEITNPGRENTYVLRIRTDFGSDIFVTCGEAEIATELDDKKKLQVSVFVEKVTNATSAHENNISTGIVAHDVDLGELNFDTKIFQIEVSVFEKGGDSNKPKATGTVGNSTIKKFGKPIL